MAVNEEQFWRGITNLHVARRLIGARPPLGPDGRACIQIIEAINEAIVDLTTCGAVKPRRKAKPLGKDPLRGGTE